MLSLGPLEIAPDEHLARASGHALTLSIRELKLLTELARRADRIVSREELFELVWERAMRPGDRSVELRDHQVQATHRLFLKADQIVAEAVASVSAHPVPRFSLGSCHWGTLLLLVARAGHHATGG